MSHETVTPSRSHQTPPENRSVNYSNDRNHHPGQASCAKCSQRWSGLKTAHCPACHQTFTALTAYDTHRTGSHARDTRQCINPLVAGLVGAGRNYPCWRLPGTYDHKK